MKGQFALLLFSKGRDVIRNSFREKVNTKSCRNQHMKCYHSTLKYTVYFGTFYPYYESIREFIYFKRKNPVVNSTRTFSRSLYLLFLCGWQVLTLQLKKKDMKTLIMLIFQASYPLSKISTDTHRSKPQINSKNIISF